MRTKFRQAAARDLAVRARRVLGPDDDIETHRTVHCPRRGGTVAITECIMCVEDGGLRVRSDGAMAVACRYEDVDARPAPAVPAAPSRPGDATHTQVTSIMTGDIVCVRSDLGLAELRQLLVGESFSGVPVVDGHGRAVGVVSRTDLVQAVRTTNGTVNDIMMPMAFTVRETATVAQAAALMAYEGIHRVPVVSVEGEVVGIVSAMDVVRWLAQDGGYVIRREAP